MAPSLIQLRGVRKTYREGVRTKTVLDGVDLDIGDGELIVLLGRSGSGKSTLLNLLSGIDLASSGEVRFDGADLGLLSEKQRTLLRRHQIGFVFQFFNLVPTLTVGENLLLPLELAGRPEKEERQRALGLLEQMGLDDRRDSYPDVLSGGEQQRLAIARALAHEPRLLLADEPTGNLDHETSLSVLGVLEAAVRDAGKTLVMATHSLDVAGLAQRILRVGQGTLNEVTAP
ncbi:MAG: ABC transporter ATP-binding protein [Holophagales bacterium]|nr:ABC transporter ATP-binding protein [Holophagales bacterium]